MAHVSDDWLSYRVGGEHAMTKRMGGLNFPKIPGLSNFTSGSATTLIRIILVFIFVNTISIISTTATKKYNGSSPSSKQEGLGKAMLFMSSLEIIALFLVLFVTYYSLKSVSTVVDHGTAFVRQQAFLAAAFMFASVSCGMHIALLLEKKKLTTGADMAFNALRIAFVLIIGVLFIQILNRRSANAYAIPYLVLLAIGVMVCALVPNSTAVTITAIITVGLVVGFLGILIGKCC